MSRIMTLHPAGKQGVNIERSKYTAMRRALLRAIPKDDAGVPFRELTRLVRAELPAKDFDPQASVGWYVTTVKLDLEARGEIELVPGKGPQRLRRLVARPR